MEVEGVHARQLIADDLGGRGAGELVGEPGLHPGLGKGGADPGQDFGLAGDDPDIEGVALVAGAGPGDVDQAHGLHRTGGVRIGRDWRPHSRGGIVGDRRARGLNCQGLAAHIDRRGQVGAGQQDREHSGHGGDGRRAAEPAGGADAHRGGRRGELTHHQAQGFGALVLGADAGDDFADIAQGRVGVGAIGRLGAQHLDAGVAEGGQVAVAQHFGHAHQHGVSLAGGLGGGLAAHHGHGADEPEAVAEGHADLVAVRGRIALGPGDQDAVRAGLFALHLREVADHVGQGVGLGIADLIEDLFGHGGRRDQAASAFGLGDDEAAVGVALHDRIADVGPVGDVAPVGEQAAGGLGAALDDVAGERAG